MKKSIVFFFLIFSFFGFSQKVKFKKGMVLIDNVEVFKYDSEGNSTTYSSLDGDEFVIVLSTSYDIPNPNGNSPGMSGAPATLKRYVYTVRFLDSGKELYTDLFDKDLAKAFFKSELFNEDGSLNQDKVDKFINKYNNETLKLKIK